jgi:S1-C subfamily serine protease
MKSCSSFAASLGLLVAALACAPAQAESVDETAIWDKSLHSYSVQVIKTRAFFKRWTLNGIYLGRGGVLTAAHVVGRWHFLKDLQVGIAGQLLPAKIVKEGTLETTDLTVLSIDETRLPVRLRLRRNPVCREPVRVGREVVVVGGLGTARSRVISPLAVSTESRAKFGSVIEDVPIAMSGTGVFDADRRCLLGIISRRVTRIDAHQNGADVARNAVEHAKYFVPAPTIADFLPPEFRF